VIVEQATLYHLRMPLRSPFETSFGRIATRDCLLLEARSGGLTGWGECVADREPGYSYETSGTAWHVLSEFMLPAVLGRPIDHPAQVQTMTAMLRGHPMARAGLEMALWDLWGQALGQSLSTLLGGVQPCVAVGVSVGLQASPEALIGAVEAYLAQGYRRIKIKIKPGRDVSDTQAVRRAFPDCLLQVDANSAYRLDPSAEAVCRADIALRPLDELGLLLIEQPLAEDDLWDHRRLQAGFATPICLDESIAAPRHARQALEMGACRVINIKTGRVGGLSQAVAIHDLCRAQSVPVWCGGMLETGVGRAANLALASLPGFSLPGDISATDRYYAQDITVERFTLNIDSTISVPQGAGLGVTIDRQALAQMTVTKAEFCPGSGR